VRAPSHCDAAISFLSVPTSTYTVESNAAAVRSFTYDKSLKSKNIADKIWG